MYALEKYQPIPCDMQEQRVITVLSVLYTLVIMCLANGLFFMSKPKLIADLAVMAGKLVGILGADRIFRMIEHRFFENPKLLILDSKRGNFFRMKRIKYNIAKNYESWYEDTSGYDLERFRQFVMQNFPKFDGICILDGLTLEEYTIALHAATQMQKDLFIAPKMIDVGRTNAKLVRFDDVLTLYMPQLSICLLYTSPSPRD